MASCTGCVPWESHTFNCFLPSPALLLVSAIQKQAGFSKMALSFDEDEFAFIEMLHPISESGTTLQKTAMTETKLGQVVCVCVCVCVFCVCCV